MIMLDLTMCCICSDDRPLRPSLRSSYSLRISCRLRLNRRMLSRSALSEIGCPDHFLQFAFQAGQTFHGAPMSPRIVHRRNQLVEHDARVRQLHANGIRSAQQLHAVIAEQDHIQQTKIAFRRLVDEAASEAAVEGVHQTVSHGDRVIGFLKNQRQGAGRVAKFAREIHWERADDFSAGALFPSRRVFHRPARTGREFGKEMFHSRCLLYTAVPHGMRESIVS